MQTANSGRACKVSGGGKSRCAHILRIDFAPGVVSFPAIYGGDTKKVVDMPVSNVTYVLWVVYAKTEP